MTYRELLDKLQTLDEEQLQQDVEIVGECIRDEYYNILEQDINLTLDDDDYSIQIRLI